MKIKNKCSFPKGIIIKPDGINNLDPCTYRTVEKWQNVTVTVSECEKCGNINISWEKQEDSIPLELNEYLFEE